MCLKPKNTYSIASNGLGWNLTKVQKSEENMVLTGKVKERKFIENMQSCWQKTALLTMPLIPRKSWKGCGKILKPMQIPVRTGHPRPYRHERAGGLRHSMITTFA